MSAEEVKEFMVKHPDWRIFDFHPINLALKKGKKNRGVKEKKV